MHAQSERRASAAAQAPAPPQHDANRGGHQASQGAKAGMADPRGAPLGANAPGQAGSHISQPGPAVQVVYIPVPWPVSAGGAGDHASRETQASVGGSGTAGAWMSRGRTPAGPGWNGEPGVGRGGAAGDGGTGQGGARWGGGPWAPPSTHAGAGASAANAVENDVLESMLRARAGVGADSTGKKATEGEQSAGMGVSTLFDMGIRSIRERLEQLRGRSGVGRGMGGGGDGEGQERGSVARDRGQEGGERAGELAGGGNAGDATGGGNNGVGSRGGGYTTLEETLQFIRSTLPYPTEDRSRV